MPSIRADHLRFHYDSPYAEVFADLAFSISTRWRTALVGRNGMGKSTLFGLLSGRLQATGGEVRVPIPTVCFPFVPVDSTLPTCDVIRDAVAPFRAWEAEMDRLVQSEDATSLERFGEILTRYQAWGGYEIDARIRKEAAVLCLSDEVLHQDFSTLSGGEQTRALIIALFLRPDTFALIDEPTNHLDLEGREMLGAYLSRKSGFLVASHDRYFLDLCVNHVLSLNKSDVRLHACTFSDWQRQMGLEEEHERRRVGNIRREVRSMQRSAQRRRGWSEAKEAQKIGTKCDTGYIGRRAALQMRRALAIERRRDAKLEEKKSLLLNAEKKRTLRLDVEAASQRLLMVENVTVAVADRRVLGGVSFMVERGERVALMGRNGCGKTSLFRAIVGELTVVTGAVELAGRTRCSRVSQIPRWQWGYLRDHLTVSGLDETRFRCILGALGVGGEVFEQPLESFSQGQRKKVDLTRSFMDSSQLLLWDEPLNYIDLVSRAQLEEVVQTHAPTMLFIEHDRAFVEAVATRTVEL